MKTTSIIKTEKAPSKPSSQRGGLTHGALHRAALQAYQRNPKRPGKCHRTAELTALFNGGSGDDARWKKDLTLRHRPLSALHGAIESGRLQPGMVIYACRRPGTDPRSLDLRNGPHWFSFLGKDEHGIPRFGDQYRTDWTLEGMEAFIPQRKVDACFDPYPAKRAKETKETKKAKMAGDRLLLSHNP